MSLNRQSSGNSVKVTESNPRPRRPMVKTFGLPPQTCLKQVGIFAEIMEKTGQCSFAAPCGTSRESGCKPCNIS